MLSVVYALQTALLLCFKKNKECRDVYTFKLCAFNEIDAPKNK